MDKDNKSNNFGLRGIINNYTKKDFLCDIWIPFLLSIIVCTIVYFFGCDTYNTLKSLVSISLSIIPSMVALILAAYTLVLTFFAGDLIIKIPNNKRNEIKKLINELNACFAVFLLVLVFSLVIFVVVHFIIGFEITCDKAQLVNYFTIFFLCLLLFYSLVIIWGIIIDLYNIGQTTLSINDNSDRENDNTNQS